MSTLMDWLGSEAWAHLVQALWHTLWMGALLALALFMVLRRMVSPILRYRCCALALFGVLVGGLLAWAWLETGARLTDAPHQSVSYAPRGPVVYVPERPDGRDGLSGAQGGRSAGHREVWTPDPGAVTGRSPRWVSWAALGWLLGTAAMLARMAAKVVRAERLRNSTHPVEDEGVLRAVREACRRLKMTRRIRVAITEKLCSPAVVGVVMPTLILPLSLVTTISTNHLQLILLHELAHIRRGDYLANLFQCLVESLMFFNPAIWWLSRQMRLEREACCDAEAAGLVEDRLEYARALAHVAEQVLGRSDVGPGMAVALADQRHPSALRDRLQRLLVPGYRRFLGLTWKALFAWLILGGALLLLSALGTQWTVKTAAKLLTPQQRIERIETAMKDLGQPLASPAADDNEKIPVEVRLRTQDGSPMPARIYGAFTVRRQNNTTTIGASPDKDGVFRDTVPRGDLYFYACAEEFAPAFFGPLDVRRSNEVENLQLTLDRGFPVRIQAVAAESGAPLGDAALACQFWQPSGSQNIGNPVPLATDAEGMALLPHCGPLPLGITVAKDGYETVEKRFDAPRSNATLVLSTVRARPCSGLVMDKLTAQPVREAEVYVLRAEEAPGVSGCDPAHPSSPLAVTDGQGRFLANRLPRNGHYWLLVKADGYADVIVPDTHPGQTNLQVTLGPELRVRGRIIGDLSGLARGPRGPRIAYRSRYEAGNYTHETLNYTTVSIEDEVGHFEFVSPIAGLLKVEAGGRTFTRDVTAPVADWSIDLSREAAEAQTRTVTLRFVHPSKVAPKGTITVDLPGHELHTALRKEMEIRDGAVSFEVPVGRDFSFEPAHTVGYWFERQLSIPVSDSPKPLEISVPVLPAGAIYAQARKVDGALAGNVSFSIAELKRSPLVKAGWPTVPAGDNWIPGGPPRQYVASPLPLGGTYRVIAQQTNTFAVSEPIQLTEAAPDRKVELQFSRGVPIGGLVLSPTGQPLPRASVNLEWLYGGSSFGWQAHWTDEKGRFTFEDCHPRLGQYSMGVHSPGCRSVFLAVNFGKLPMTVRLEPGLKLRGRVIEEKSGRPVLGAQVRALAEAGGRPAETTQTDEGGVFLFDTLSDANYNLYVEGCYYEHGSSVVKAGTAGPVVLKMAVIRGASVRLGGEAK